MLEHINKLEQDYYDKTQTNEKFTELESNKVGNKDISASLYDKNNNQVLPYNINSENGIYIQGRGAYGYEATYAVTDFIAIIGIDKIKWNGYLPIAKSDVAALAFYNYKKNFISNISRKYWHIYRRKTRNRSKCS